MGEAELPRVQHLSRRRASLSVKQIADYRMSEMMEMHANLMRAPTVQRAFEQTHAVSGLQNAVFCSGISTAAPIDRHFFPLHGMSTDGDIDCPVRPLQFPGDQSEINLLHFALCELMSERLMGHIVFCDHETTARLFVETMNNAWALFAADAGEAGAVMEQRIDERMRLIARARMHDETGGFV